MPINPGRFITFEGGEGSGKSTQIGLLRERLIAAGVDALVTREPGGTEGAEAIRSLLVSGHRERWRPETEALLHFAARKEHLEHLILPALQAGRWVVCDRFVDSTLAYQGFAQGLGQAFIETLSRLVIGDFRPDLTLILDLPSHIGLERANGRIAADGKDGQAAEDRYERMGERFHETLRRAFLDIAAREPERCVVIDAARDPDHVADAVWRAACQRLPELA